MQTAYAGADRLLAYENAKNQRFWLSKKKKKRYYSVGGEAGGGGIGGSVAPPNKNLEWCWKTLLKMYLTILVTQATSNQSTFSALRRLKTKDHEAGPPEQLHKSITETLNSAKIAKRFACANERRKGI